MPPSQPTQQPTLTLFAIGMVGLGIIALIYSDFALQTAPTPTANIARKHHPQI